MIRRDEVVTGGRWGYARSKNGAAVVNLSIMMGLNAASSLSEKDLAL